VTRPLSGRIALLLTLGALLFAAWRSVGALRSPAEAPACTCELARLRNGWCESCGRGYVAGCEIRSRVLFDGLDAHGHELDAAVMACETCKALMKSGGFCESCRFGWVDGKAYMSRLTYCLAKGRTRDLASVSCATCRTLAGGVGWCEACQGGWTGNVYFDARSEHAAAAKEFERLQAAIAASERCETCALVLLVDGKCPYCGITYADGKAVAAKGS